MSKMLFVSIPQTFQGQINHQNILDYLWSCGAIPKDTLQKIRFQFTMGAKSTMIETYVNTTSLLNWLVKRKKRDVGIAILTSIIRYLLTNIEKLSLMVFKLKDGESEDVVTFDGRVKLTLRDLINIDFKSSNNIEYIFERCRVYKFQGVEVELSEPLKVDEKNTAIGFISEYCVVATHIDMAKELLKEAVENDEGILVGFESVNEEDIIIDNFVEKYWRKGKAYFGV